MTRKTSPTPPRAGSPRSAAPAVRGDRVDALGTEELLAAVEDAGDLGDGAPHPLGVEPRRDPAHVRQVGHRGQAATAEVEPVELHLVRRVGEREGGDQGAQQGRLARLGAADHHHVARRGGRSPGRGPPASARRACRPVRAEPPGRPERGTPRGGHPARRRPSARAAARPAPAHGPAAAATPGAPKHALPLQPLHDDVQHGVGQGVVLLPPLGVRARSGSGAAYTTGTGAAVNSAGRRSTGARSGPASGPAARYGPDT